MKKQIFSILILAICVACFGLTGCGQNKPPCELGTFKPLDGVIVKGVGEMKKLGWVVYFDAPEFFKLNPQCKFNSEEGDLTIVRYVEVTGEETTDYFSGQYSMAVMGGDDCGKYFILGKPASYAIQIGVLRNTVPIFFKDLVYPDSGYECPLDDNAMCLNPSEL